MWLGCVGCYYLTLAFDDRWLPGALEWDGRLRSSPSGLAVTRQCM